MNRYDCATFEKSYAVTSLAMLTSGLVIVLTKATLFIVLCAYGVLMFLWCVLLVPAIIGFAKRRMANGFLSILFSLSLTVPVLYAALSHTLSAIGIVLSVFSVIAIAVNAMLLRKLNREYARPSFLGCGKRHITASSSQ